MLSTGAALETFTAGINAEMITVTALIITIQSTALQENLSDTGMFAVYSPKDAMDARYGRRSCIPP